MQAIIDWINNNQDMLIEYSIKVIVAIVILFAASIVTRILASIMRKGMQKRQVDNAVISFLTAIVKSLIFIAALMVALNQIGVETTSFIAILGAAGLAIGLALQGSLSNIASGVLLIMFRPIRSGEYVEAAGTAGTVEEINIFQTILKTPDRKVVYLPNSQVIGSAITNYNREPIRRIDLVIGVSYSANLQKTKKVLMEVLKNDERILQDPEPVVTVTALNSSSVDFNVRPWTKTEDHWPTRWDLLEKIKDRLDEEGIGIPFPQMDVHIKKEDKE
ncbi:MULTISPECIES: mechanosensitive ion channel family protein [Idiomarina]|jgi:small conductance mechanosensitive channel|uniref:Small-conductance mechanosensitive channel n=1 Tax=Idiomarina baltica OS145 TaxID=314276 RepID=A0ABP2CP46_9GAMM|nr:MULTISPECIES: mechanosensitive ion channel domain-containing protein [Idiomarina]MAD52493.1 mechanosensitive ion channel protein [Idiomarinaceae bacterium]MEC8926605.1 mechanosensitive ion channel domain-containing protein [Pseudomonadota bacterium]EAQ31403.1 Small-conductance mechanosensitive channel [Idiomarina baltica OS145]KXS36413.1 MAG: small-conductance mechanosensitive channel [Idiomarina sp. T82-3]MAF75621.1 mechanosensitive ion channel protein [Idiomarinaceae bacterium]|tara:strand:- start:412 stop:1236 length:825 start_codon:yes stop_codon:yes gene_type:complete